VPSGKLMREKQQKNNNNMVVCGMIAAMFSI
jgi:hypothetical protein